MLSQNNGSQETADGQFHDPTELRNLPPGNMVYAHGCLVIAGMRELVVYAARPRANGGSN